MCASFHSPCEHVSEGLSAGGYLGDESQGRAWGRGEALQMGEKMELSGLLLM